MTPFFRAVKLQYITMTNLAPLRLNILSDLHLSRGNMPLPNAKADVVILAGDISRPKEAIEWARNFTVPVIYVAGNHEFYGNSIDGTFKELNHHSAGTTIHVLDKGELVIGGVRFIGTTLWTDFMLYGDGPPREQAIAEAVEFMLDYRQIRSATSPQKTFTPMECEALFNDQRLWLAQKLSEPFDGPTVVITHHAPSPKSIHPRFAGSLINTCFVSDSESLMGGDRASLWVHGHTHDSFDYVVKGTRVVCNPRGYAKSGINENALFDPNFVVEISR